MADSTAGGRQVDGFHGISLEYMRSPKFLSADGGYARIAWMPSELKELVKAFIPSSLVDKIATEKEVKTVSELRDFLIKNTHPVIERWKTEEDTAAGEHTGAVQVFSGGDFPLTAGGFKIIFKNARIYADKVVIMPVQPKKPGAGD